MLEWIGRPCSSFPTCDVYTHVPPTLEALSHTMGVKQEDAEICRAAQRPAAPAPITPTTFIIYRGIKMSVCVTNVPFLNMPMSPFSDHTPVHKIDLQFQ